MIPLLIGKGLGIPNQWSNFDFISCEDEFIHPTESRSIFVLLADRESQGIMANLVGFLCNLIPCETLASVGGKDVDHCYCHRPGGPESGARWSIAVDGHVQSASRWTEESHCREGDFKGRLRKRNLSAVKGQGGPVIVGFHVNSSILSAVQLNVNEAIDSGANHSALELSIVGCEIGASSREAYAKWGFSHQQIVGHLFQLYELMPRPHGRSGTIESSNAQAN